MKGLLYKDFIVNRKNLIALAEPQLFFMIVSIVTACLLKNADLVANTNMAIVIFMFFWARIYEPRYFKEDENLKWSVFVSSTPGTYKEQVLGKYYFMFLVSLVVLFVNNFLDLITTTLCNDVNASIMALIFLIFCFFLLEKAIVTPFMVRFGSGAPLYVWGGILGIVFVGLGIYALFGDLPITEENSDPVLLVREVMAFFQGDTGMWIMALLPWVALAAYYISYRISLLLYREGAEHYGE